MSQREAIATVSGLPKQKVLEKDARKRRPGYGVLCVLMGLLTVGVLAHVAIHLKHLETALALGEARREHSELRERKRKLDLEIGVLKNPERVLAIAREKLGLRPPAVTDIVPLSELGRRVKALYSTGVTDDPGEEDDKP